MREKPKPDYPVLSEAETEQRLAQLKEEMQRAQDEYDHYMELKWQKEAERMQNQRMSYLGRCFCKPIHRSPILQLEEQPILHSIRILSITQNKKAECLVVTDDRIAIEVMDLFVTSSHRLRKLKVDQQDAAQCWAIREWDEISQTQFQQTFEQTLQKLKQHTR